MSIDAVPRTEPHAVVDPSGRPLLHAGCGSATSLAIVMNGLSFHPRLPRFRPAYHRDPTTIAPADAGSRFPREKMLDLVTENVGIISCIQPLSGQVSKTGGGRTDGKPGDELAVA